MKNSSDATKYVIRPVLYLIGYLVILLYLMNVLTGIIRRERVENYTDQHEIKITLNKAE